MTDVDDLNLALAIRERLAGDPRVANFGEQWLTEDRVPRFSRGDLRRLRDYMQEKEQPLTDDDLVQDVLAVRPGRPTSRWSALRSITGSPTSIANLSSSGRAISDSGARAGSLRSGRLGASSTKLEPTTGSCSMKSLLTWPLARGSRSITR